MDMRRSKVVLIVIATLVFGVSAAVAANVHFKKSPPLTFNDGGLTLNATGALTGLGNGDIVIQLTAQGQPVATCTNGGQHQAPGQNPAVVTLGGLQAIPGSQVKNGNVGFNVDTGGPQTPIPGAPGCPNGNWTEDINDVIFSGFNATITVFQGIGCAIDPGPPPAPNANCVQVFQSIQTVP
jgi:hypothetical protein